MSSIRRTAVTLTAIACVVAMTPTRAAASRPWFVAPYSWHAPGARHLATGDMDRDGNTDVVVADGDVTSIVRGNGDGGLRAPEPLAIGDGFDDVAVGDVNGDRWLDIVATRSSAHAFVVCESQQALFGAERSYACGVTPRGILLHDFDNDGDLDVIAGGTPVTVWLNDGYGVFTSRIDVPLAGKPAAADLDRDGLVDVVAASETQVWRALALSASTFAAPELMGEWEEGVNDIDLGDYDGDGFTDLFVAGFGGTFVNGGLGVSGFGPRLASSAAALQQAPRDDAGPSHGPVPAGSRDRVDPDKHGTPIALDVALGDLDGDKQLDYFAAMEFNGNTFPTACFLDWGGHGGFMIAPGSRPRAVAFADLDNDGLLDMVGAGWGGLMVSLQNPDHSFGAPLGSVGYCFTVAVGDANADDIDDLVCVDGERQETILFMSNGAGGFDRRSVEPYQVPIHTYFADLDGDGWLEFIAIGYESATIFPGKPGGPTQPGQAYLAKGDTIPIDDRSGDGIDDFIVEGTRFVLGTKDGSPGKETPFTGMGEAELHADFDGDGVLDLAALTNGLDAVDIQRGRADGQFDHVQSIGTAEYPRGLVLGQFDKDPRLDLAVIYRGASESNDGGFALLLNRATVEVPVVLGDSDPSEPREDVEPGIKLGHASSGRVVFSAADDRASSLTIFDVSGRRITDLAARASAAGPVFEWDARHVARGVYFARARSGSKAKTITVVVR